MEEQRKLFEAWIVQNTFWGDVSRFDDAPTTLWRGHYREYSVQLAWEAWQEALRQAVSFLASKARPPTIEEKRT